MKATSTDLLQLMLSGQFVRADLWTITLNGGTVIRWTSADRPISYGGNTFVVGPAIDRGTVSEKVGVEVSTLDITLYAEDEDLINGSPLIPFIKGHGLDGALIKLERAYAPDWNSPITGTLIRFSGKVTSIPSVMGGEVKLTVSSWTVLLSLQSPRNLFQASCLRVLYDTNCAVNPNSFKFLGSVSSGGSTTSFSTNITGTPSGYYAQGRIVFTSGPNNGISRTVKTDDGAGNIKVVGSLPVAPGVGDTFTIYAGCDLSKATCASKFNNLVKFKGTPFVPVATASLGVVNPVNGSSGGKG